MGFMQETISRKLARKNTTNEIVDIYDALMSEYGYIPLKDFLEMPQSLINRLTKNINQRRKKSPKLGKRH